MMHAASFNRHAEFGLHSNMDDQYYDAIAESIKVNNDPVKRAAKIKRRDDPCYGRTRKSFCNGRGKPTVQQPISMVSPPGASGSKPYNGQKCACTDCDEGYLGKTCEIVAVGGKNDEWGQVGAKEKAAKEIKGAKTTGGAEKKEQKQKQTQKQKQKQKNNKKKKMKKKKKGGKIKRGTKDGEEAQLAHDEL